MLCRKSGASRKCVLAPLRPALERANPAGAQRSVVGFRKNVMEVQATYIPADLIFVVGKQSGRRVQLNSPRFIIGREVDCTLQLEDNQLSRHHAVLLADAYGIRIRD